MVSTNDHESGKADDKFEDKFEDKLESLTLHISQVVLDNASKSDFISCGYYGVIYRLRYDGTLYAAKYQDFDDDPYKLKHFQQECLLHSKLYHPNIVQMLGICYHSNSGLNQPVKVMELLELDLLSLIRNYFTVPMYVKLTIIQDISRGLEYLHTRNPPIVHSFLTMTIILLTTNLVTKIGGFTFAVEMVPEITRLPKQTGHHTDNEMLKSSLYCGPPFDILSFGQIICKIVTKESFSPMHKCGLVDNTTGRLFSIHLYNSSRCSHVINMIEDTSLKQLVLNCMNDNPDLRPSALQIIEIITDMIKGEFYSFLLLVN